MNYITGNGADTWRWVEDGADLNTVKRQKHPLKSYSGISLSQPGSEQPVVADAEIENAA